MRNCPHCFNPMGFVFGKCIECGFNHLSDRFNSIKVDVSDLPENVRDYLIRKHARRTERMYARKEDR
jgi:hypothetical protein